MASPYVNAFSDNISVPGGGTRQRKLHRTSSTRKCWKWKSSSADVFFLDIILFASLPPLTFVSAESPKMTRTPEAVGKEGDGFRINTMMLSFPIQIARWRRNCVGADRASIWSTTVFATLMSWQRLFSQRWLRTFGDNFWTRQQLCWARLYFGLFSSVAPDFSFPQQIEINWK